MISGKTDLRKKNGGFIHEKKRMRQFVVAGCMIVALTGIGSTSVWADYNGKSEKVSIAQSTRNVATGKKFEIRATVQPGYAEDD